MNGIELPDEADALEEWRRAENRVAHAVKLLEEAMTHAKAIRLMRKEKEMGLANKTEKQLFELVRLALRELEKR